MEHKSKRYGLLIGVGIYQDKELKRLSGTAKDLGSMKEALTGGLRFDPENLRILGEDGTVEARSFAMALSGFNKLLKEEDTFVFYFSGHGTQERLCFTDEVISLESITGFIERLPARQKVMILDCCYSGEAEVSAKIPSSFEEAVTSLAGKGIAVLASCAKDERSWLSEAQDSSLYTQIVSAALQSRHIRSHLKKGYVSLNDVNDEIRYLMQLWNSSHPDRQQHPVYRENYIGDITLKVEEYHPYTPEKITAETDTYLLLSVKPHSTGNLKRFAAFIILKRADDTMLPAITKEIVSQFRNSDVYASESSEQRFKGRSADAIWCYFGYDDEDIQRSNHFAYTIWAENEELKRVYYRENRNAEVVDGIYVFWNPSYGMVKDLQRSTSQTDEIPDRYRTLAGLLIAKAETFIKEFEEVGNGTISLDLMKERFGVWIRDVKNAYFYLSDAEPVPAKWNDWSEAVLEMAGWVVDMALFLDAAKDQGVPGEKWMIQNAISRYRQSMEDLKEVEYSPYDL